MGSSAPRADEAQGFFLGAGWQGQDQLMVRSLPGPTGGSGPQLGVSVLRTARPEPLATSLPSPDYTLSQFADNQGFQLRAGYDFGTALGFLALNQTSDPDHSNGRLPLLSLGFSVPIGDRIQVVGEIQPHDLNRTLLDQENVWTVSAAFRF